jgi:hypothetical protein
MKSKLKPNAIRMLILLVLSVGCVGCASTQQSVRLPDQSKLVEDGSKGRIYVMRPASFGAAVKMEVRDNGKLIGETGPSSFLCWEREPGNTTLSSRAETTYNLDLSVQANHVYYILQRVEWGVWYGRCKLEEVGPNEGQRILKKCSPPKAE